MKSCISSSSHNSPASLARVTVFTLEMKEPGLSLTLPLNVNFEDEILSQERLCLFSEAALLEDIVSASLGTYQLPLRFGQRFGIQGFSF